MKNISIIKAKFLRLREEMHSTRLWDDVSETNKYLILQAINLISNEEAVLCFYPNTFYWWVITNKRLIINDNSKIFLINLSDIKQFEVKNVIENTETKQSCSSIYLNLQDNSIKLKVEENTWHIIYNMLKFILDK